MLKGYSNIKNKNQHINTPIPTHPKYPNRFPNKLFYKKILRKFFRGKIPGGGQFS